MTGPATPPAGGQDPAQGPSTPLSGTTQDPATSVSKLGYVEFTTPDLDRLTEYYTSALSFELVERTADRAFLTTGFDHHCVVLKRGDAAGRTTVGYEVADSLADAQRRIRAAGYEVSRRSDIAPSTPSGEGSGTIIDERTPASAVVSAWAGLVAAAARRTDSGSPISTGWPVSTTA